MFFFFFLMGLSYTSDLEETKDEGFVVLMVDFLIKTHLVGDPSAVTPLPQDLLREDDRAISQCILSFSFILFYFILFYFVL